MQNLYLDLLFALIMTSLLIETYEYNLQQNRIDPFNEMHTEDYGELEGLENHFV